MRTLDEVMTALEGSTWFTTIDLVDGFFSLPLYPADRGFTAFHTPLGLFKWEVLPQGTSASPAIFQRMMDRWFSAYLWKNVLVWIDDILVYSNKLAAVHRIPVPSSRKQVRQFLGFANFYRRFLPPNFSTVIAPLTALTSEKNPFKMPLDFQYSFF